MGIKSALLDPQLRSPSLRGDYYEYYRNLGMVDLVEETETSISSWIKVNLGSKAVPENFEVYDREYRNMIDSLSE